MTGDLYTTIRVVGGLLPRGTLDRIAINGSDLPGRKPADYDLVPGQTIRTAANQAWADLTAAWATFKKELESTGEDDPATGLTRDRWLKFLFANLGYGPLRQLATTRGGITLDDTEYPVSHAQGPVPIHLVGANVDLDRRTPGVAGAARKSPYSLVQELLNHSDNHLWGIVSNGRSLLLLRDSTSMVRQAFIEFDLEEMFDGEVFSDFVVLYLVCHATRVAVRDEEAGPPSCWLERWREEAIAGGTRALDQLRDGVTEALRILGQGFVAHPDNRELREDLTSGSLSSQQYYRSLLRLVYRLLFCFVAEERGVLLDPDPDAGRQAIDRYEWYFSMRRLRRLASRRHRTRHGDLWVSLQIVFNALGSDEGLPELALPAMGSALFESSSRNGSEAHLDACALHNRDLLEAVRHLSQITEQSGLTVDVDYRNLDAEELGSVYESLLELAPRYDPATSTFTLEELAGNERKTTGSYYTPSALIDCLLDTALDPLLDEAIKSKDPGAALLELTVCDPACGSGHFLVAAARRIARRLASVRTGDAEPSERELRKALREVISRCIYGVDVNELAAELARVSLWLEAVERGKPLPFLDAHIKVGNALLGVTPRLLAEGVPDDAFKPLTGDDRKVASSLKARNRKERYDVARGTEQLGLFSADTNLVRVGNARLSARADEVARHADDSIGALHERVAAWRRLEESTDLARARMVANAWCAAFVWPKEVGAPVPPTSKVLTQLQRDPRNLPSGTRKELAETRAMVQRLSDQYRFFHWHLEFPEVFRVPDNPKTAEHPELGWSGGFSCVLGNPPWERVKLQEQEFFAARHEGIAKAPNKAARQQMIKELEVYDPALLTEFEDARRRAEGESHLLRDSGRYPLCGRGDINTYAVFAETDRVLVGPRGRMGVVVPLGIATDATTQHYFGDLVSRRHLASLFGFENEAKIFPTVHNQYKFCLLTVGGRSRTAGRIYFSFYIRHVGDLAAGVFSMTPEEILLINPNTRTCPTSRSRRDAEIMLRIYRRVRVLVRRGDSAGNPWSLSFMTMLHMAIDSELFFNLDELEGVNWALQGNVFVRGGERCLPLYEAKLFHQFDHRYATYLGATREQMNKGTLPKLAAEEHDSPVQVILPRYWVQEEAVRGKLERLWDRGWLLVWRDISRSVDERTAIMSIVPTVAVGHTAPIMLAVAGAPSAACLLAAVNSLVNDYCLRQKLGGAHLTYSYVEQMPIPPPSTFAEVTGYSGDDSLEEWVVRRVLELVYTAEDMRSFADDLGFGGEPFRWFDDRRAMLRAELDAAMFTLYGVDRADAEYILGTFPIVERNEIARHGEYRTKRLILDAYDRMAEATTTGLPYQTILDPPPGQGPRHPAATAPLQE